MSDQAIEMILYRRCPTCGGAGRAAATKCGYCWAKLTPLADGDPGIERRPAVDVQTTVDSAEMKRYREAPRRDCPRCGRTAMADATTCGFCWLKLTPLTGLGSEEHASAAAASRAALQPHG